MINEIRRILSQMTPSETADAIIGVVCLFALVVLFLILTP